MKDAENRCRQHSAPDQLHDLKTAALLAGVPTPVLECYRDYGVAISFKVEGADGFFFEDDTVYRVRRAEHIRRSHNIDPRTAALIMALLERVEGLETEVAFWRE